MDRIDEQTFGIDGRNGRVLGARFGFWFCGAAAIFCCGLAVTAPNKIGLAVMIPMTLVCVGFAYFLFRVTQQFGRAAVSVDEDGIWLVHLGKSQGLVRWADVDSIREIRYGQIHGLELVGRDGVSLIKLLYELAGFEALRQIVLAKTNRSRFHIECPATFKKSAAYHILVILEIIVFTAAACYVVRADPGHGLFYGVLCLGLAVVVSVYYLAAVAGLTIDRRTLSVRYPLRTKTIALSEIEAIYLRNQTLGRGRTVPAVIIASHGQRPVQLKQLRIDAIALCDILNRWKNEKLFD